MEKDFTPFLKELAIPRFSGGEGERIVREKIINYMKELGFNVEAEDFRFSTFPAEIFQRGILLLFWLLLSLIIFFKNFLLFKILFYFFIFLSLFFLTRWSEKIEFIYNIFRKRISSNILACRKKGDTEILFVAHYDSKSQFLPLPLRVSLFFLFLLFTLIVPLSGNLWRLFFILQSVSLVLLILNITSNASPGGIDNASGVLALLILAEKIKDERVAFLFTGAEEMGLCGALEFLKKHEKELSKKTIIINVDGIGDGNTLILTTKFGIPPRKTSKQIHALLKKVAEKNGIKVKEGWLPFGAGLDHIPFAVKGYESVTVHLSSFKDAFFVHTSKDTPERVNLQRIKQISEILYQFLKQV